MDNYIKLIALRKLRDIHIPLSTGIVITCLLPIYMSEQEIDEFIRAITFMKPALSSSPSETVIANAEEALIADLYK